MCNAVIDGNLGYSRPDELIKLVGIDNLVWQDKNPFSRWPVDQDWRRMDLCLCPVNLSKTLGRAGLKFRKGDHTKGEDPMEYFIIRDI